MRCILCQKYSIPIICDACQKNLLTPTLSARVVGKGFKVYSFYRYSDIAPLLKTKHTHIGAAVYGILAKNAFGWFRSNFIFDEEIGIIPVDDRPKSGYAHTAILAKALKSRHLHPYYGTLYARSDLSYSGKTLAYRQSHPREFRYSGKKIEHAIIVDDIITTGTTLLEAKATLEKVAVVPMFALTMADASES
jgi:competence protein ComFC